MLFYTHVASLSLRVHQFPILPWHRGGTLHQNWQQESTEPKPDPENRQKVLILELLLNSE